MGLRTLCILSFRSLSPPVCRLHLPLQRPLVLWEHSLTASHCRAVWPGLIPPAKPFMWRGLSSQGSLHTSFGAPALMGFSVHHRLVHGYLSGACPGPLLLCPLPSPRACPTLSHAAPPSPSTRASSLGGVELLAKNLLGRSQCLTRGLARSSEVLLVR